MKGENFDMVTKVSNNVQNFRLVVGSVKDQVLFVGKQKAGSFSLWLVEIPNTIFLLFRKIFKESREVIVTIRVWCFKPSGINFTEKILKLSVDKVKSAQ